MHQCYSQISLFPIQQKYVVKVLEQKWTLSKQVLLTLKAIPHLLVKVFTYVNAFVLTVCVLCELIKKYFVYTKVY